MTPIEHIHARGRFSGKPGLHRIRALCEALGNPQKKLKFIHIAGTNGKGSTAAMLASIFQQAGYHTGLFTSPFLVTFHERIQVDGYMIDDHSLIRLVRQVEAAEKTLALPQEEHIGEFEFVTAMAFLYFVEQNCEIVILETGLGGEFDATNVIETPVLAVFTPISLDHTEVLGRTTGEIAQTKAGIIKPGGSVVCAYGQPDDALEIIQLACPAVQIPDMPQQIQCDFQGVHFIWKGQKWHCPMIGAHQVQNSCTALQAVYAAKQQGWDVPDNAVSVGLAKARIIGRMEILHQNPTVIVDGGHNIAGVKAIASTIKTLACKGILHLVVGMVSDKDIHACTFTLDVLNAHVYVTQPDNERALAAEKLAEYFQHPIGIYPVAAEAFQAAFDAAGEDDIILICGSLYLAGIARKFFTA